MQKTKTTGKAASARKAAKANAYRTALLRIGISTGEKRTFEAVRLTLGYKNAGEMLAAARKMRIARLDPDGL